MSVRCVAFPLLLLLLLGVCCPSHGSPAVRQRRSPFDTLPGGLPLSAIFALCEASDETDDIGPCLADLLRGAIQKARPDFATGLKIGRDTVILEPFELDDIEPKKDKTFQVAFTNLNVHGISTLSINNITFSSDELALSLTFANVTATGDGRLKYLFLSASPQINLEVANLTVLVFAKWQFGVNPEDPERLDIVLHNATANFELDDISAKFDGLGSVGSFLRNIINRNSKTLVRFLVPALERSVSKKLNRKLNRIKIAD